MKNLVRRGELPWEERLLEKQLRPASFEGWLDAPSRPAQLRELSCGGLQELMSGRTITRIPITKQAEGFRWSRRETFPSGRVVEESIETWSESTRMDVFQDSDSMILTGGSMLDRLLGK